MNMKTMKKCTGTLIMRFSKYIYTESILSEISKIIS